MKYILTIIIFSFCLFGATTTTHGQEDCARKLERAKRLYEDGSPQMIPDLLEDCRKSKALTKDGHIEVLQLIAQSYLELNNTQKAEEYYLKILDINPDYRPNIAASPELFYMAEEMERNPYLMFSMKGGMGLILVNKIKDFNINIVSSEIGATVSMEDYNGNFESQYGAAIEFNLFKSNFDLSTGVAYGNYSFEYSSISSFTNAPPFITGNLVFTERQKWLSLPILLRYNIRGGSFLGRENRPERIYTPYLYIGFSPQWLFGAEIENPDLDGTNVDGQIISADEYTGLPLTGNNFPELRNSWNMSFLAGAGIKRKFGNLYVFLEAGISNMGQNVSDIDNKLAASPPEGSSVKILRENYFYVDDDFKLSRLGLSVGFTYSFYRLLKNVYRD